MGVAVLGASLWMIPAAGCSIGLSASSSESLGGADASTTFVANPETDAGTPVVAKVVAVDASDTGALAFNTAASPLCGITRGALGTVACDPDDGTCTPAEPPGGVEADASTAEVDAAELADAAYPLGDAGYGFADAAEGAALDAATGPAVAAVFACHVTAAYSEAGVASASAVCSAAGTGKNEATCTASFNCAPGFECVIDDAHVPSDGAPTLGVCRRYCCDNVCPSANSFCDIETTVAGSVSVPVCVAHPAYVGGATDAGAECELLDDASCPAGLACQVVSAAGEVACVTPGTATAGEPCEATKCAKGLSCISGYFPDRQCSQLCELEGNDCPAGQKCVQDATVTTTNPTIGVCG